MLPEYIKTIKRNLFLIIALGLLTGVATFIFTVNQTSYYQTSLSLLVSSAEIQETADYRFDGYYTIQATDLFSNTVEAWLKSPDVVSGIFSQADIDLKDSSIKSLTKIFKSEKLSPHYVEVRYDNETKDEASRIATSITTVLAEKAKVLNDISKNQTAFTINSGEPIIKLINPPVLLNTIIGLAAGLLLGFFIGILKEYLL